MRLLTIIMTIAILTSPFLHAAKKDDSNTMTSELFSAMKLRNIGPAYMSGRIADIEVDSKNPSVWYIACLLYTSDAADE